MRLGRAYFVQTPAKHSPIESHSLLPFAGFLPRFLLLPVLRLSNRLWIKTTDPDWNLLTPREMKELFPRARILHERVLGMTKSVMAIKPQPQGEES